MDGDGRYTKVGHSAISVTKELRCKLENRGLFLLCAWLIFPLSLSISPYTYRAVSSWPPNLEELHKELSGLGKLAGEGSALEIIF